jgi:aconitate hydratase
MQREPAPRPAIKGARMLAMYGDMLTTDHISPIGVISKNTPAAKYLESLGITPKDFVSYAARRLNHDVMIRGTFANVRIRNELVPGTEGSVTRHEPSGDILTLYDAAIRYVGDGVPLVVVGGAEYGAGSSRDWAAKGTRLLGVRAVIAESFERIHRTNLVGMGVLPLQFPAGVTRKTLKLDGSEIFDIEDLKPGPLPRQQVQCTLTRRDGSSERITLQTRLDTLQELEYHRHGGTFELIIRRRLAAAASH